MTNPRRKVATFHLMTRHPIPRPVLAMLPLLLAWSPLRADEPPLRELLRDALYAEEVARDSEKAAKQYEELLARHDAQKTFAAAALFRLAEVRRKQDRKDDAILLYQRLLAEFPNAETETRLAKENLVALGGKMPAANAVVQDAEAAELARLENLAETSPDILLDQDTLWDAVENDRSKVVKYLLARGSKPFEGEALILAAKRGNLEIVKLLTNGEVSVPEKVASDTIVAAIQYDRHTILEFLLNKGLKQGTATNSYGQIPEFILAVLDDKRKGAEILLQHGADVNAMVADASGPDFKPCGTALHLVLSAPDGKFDIAKWLLEKGAEPDLPDPCYGLTPLHYAAMNESPGALGIIEKLLDADADPNRRSKDRSFNHPFKRAFLMNSTPLETAIAFPGAKLEKIRLLLKHGAKPDQQGSRVAGALALMISTNDPSVSDLIEVLGTAGFPMRDRELLSSAAQAKDPEILGLLLKHGADPNTKDAEENSLLIYAAKAGDAGSLALLVNAGADVHAESANGKSALLLASSAQNPSSAMESTKILLDAGAKPDEEWINEGFNRASYPIRRLLIERFTIPSLANDSGIVLLIDKISSMQTIRTSKPVGDTHAPSLAKWILDSQGQIENFPTTEKLKHHWAVWRRNSSGVMVKQDIDFNAPQELPALEWGDVVTCLIEMPTSLESYGFSKGFPREFLWSLRRHISFPITFETDGKIREIIVRGDRIFFDPTKNEVPLKPLQQVVEYFWMTPVEMETLPIIHVSRNGWPDIRLSYNSKEAEKFELEAGDRVKLEIPDQVKENLAKARRQFVTLKVEGYPFARSIGVLSEWKVVASSIPTLMQALVDIQVPWWSPVWMESATNQTVDVANMHEEGAFTKFTLFPHPDLASIRIRRLMENGAEEVIEVNLAKVIAASTGQTTAEEARKVDVILLPGDVVEVSLLKDRLGEPWKGFSAQEESFFAKALSGRVRVTDNEGNITVRDLIYKAPRFIESEWGWIPLPPESGIASIRGVWLIPNGTIILKRGDYQSGDQQASGTFIQDGDEIKITSVNRPPRVRVVLPPQPVQQPRMPRPAVVPPPQP
jgi:ankyrin repeat protein